MKNWTNRTSAFGKSGFLNGGPAEGESPDVAVPLAALPLDTRPPVLKPAPLLSCYLAFWSGQLALWLFAYQRYDGLSNPVFTAVFDTLSWMAVGTLAMGVGFILPITPRQPVRLFMAVLVGAVALVLLRLISIELLAPLFGWTTPGVKNLFFTLLPRHALITTSYVALGCGLRSAVRTQREHAQLVELDSALAAARLVKVRTQLRPRMLLAAMQSIADQSEADPRGADTRIMQLSELLRLQLHRGAESAVSLEQEVDFVRRYIRMEQVASSLATEFKADVEARAEATMVPPNILSILVESALRCRPEPAPAIRLDLVARLTDGVLHLQLRDTCPVPLSLRKVAGWEEVLILWESLREQFGPSCGPHFVQEPSGVTARVSLPVQERGHP